MLRTAKRGGAWPRATSALLATLLALGLPGAGLDAVASEPSVHQPGATALSVASEPAGVAVYVDGRPHGQTPVTLSDVGAGEHRLLLVKDGYLANRRVVSVKAGQTGAVHVTMTPAAGGARHGMQQDPGSESGGGGGGGGKKALLIGLGVAAAGAGAYLLLAGGNDPPVPGTISMSPTGTGMAGVTSFTFTSQGASDPDDDLLTYTWAFGDGQSGSGASTSHVYGSAGNFTVTLTVADQEASATTTASVTTASNLSATFQGRVPGVGNPAILRITQSGGNITGTLSFIQPADRSQRIFCTGTCTGSISGSAGQTYPSSVTFSGNINSLTVSFSGSSANGETISGTSNWSLPACCTGGGSSTFTRQ